MTTSPHTPDPAQGAIINALGGGTGLIYEADDNEPVRAAIDRLTTEQLADWIAYIRDRLTRQEFEWDNTGAGGTAENNRFNFVDTPSAGVFVFELPATATNGDVIECAAYSIPFGNSWSVIRDGAGVSIVTMTGNAGGTTQAYCMVRWFNANWHIVTAHSNETITYGEVD